jgi:hypothetical protein
MRRGVWSEEINLLIIWGRAFTTVGSARRRLRHKNTKGGRRSALSEFGERLNAYAFEQHKR